MVFMGKALGMRVFLKPPYEGQVKLWKVWKKNALLTEKWTYFWPGNCWTFFTPAGNVQHAVQNPAYGSKSSIRFKFPAYGSNFQHTVQFRCKLT